MSLLLKALKQAESAHAERSDPDRRAEGDLELEPLPVGGVDDAREWVEPPSLLFGSNGIPAETGIRPAFRWPRLSLVPLTALLAAIVALGYGAYLYLALQPPATAEAAIPPAPASTPVARVAPTRTAEPQAALPVAATPVAPSTDESVAAISTPLRDEVAPPQPRRKPSAPAAGLPVFQPDVQTALLTQAYAAYQRGALSDAQRIYAQAARSGSLDALLGLAAIASIQNRDTDAQRLYGEVLERDPRNATAQAALLDLLGNTDSQATESRLKILIDREPSANLYQTLGNLYAEQGRWDDAQPAYFEAYRRSPDNPDYAFNLAVSLDQLGQRAAAVTYYEKALAGTGTHRFDRIEAESRMQQLKSVR